MLRGDLLWCQLFSEPGAGSDLAGLQTRALRSGDGWVVTGQKTWSSFAHFADWGYLLARTDSDVPKHRGISYFLLDMKTPGIEVRPLRQITGAAMFNEVFLEDVRIPDANRLGREGGGWAVANTTLMYERMAMGGLDRQFSFDDLVALAKASDRPLDGVLRDELARLYTWGKALELLNARIMTKIGRGENPMTESSVVKLALARLYSKAGELGLRLQGSDALGWGAWQKHFLEAPAFHIAGGTDEVQKNIAAERVLGLPREPDPSRELPFRELPRS
jgi:alkylation response protein AidB-like acyl-CoA dehydrogenase